MRLLVGLGNPGSSYENTRHNFGFQIIDEIRAVYRLPDFRLKGKSLTTQGNITEAGVVVPVVMLKPQTYMNLSGPAVAEVARFYKILPQDIIVFHDDLDLKLGQVRIKQGGGNGGHNGLRSLDATIGKEYWRVRLGIDHPGAAPLVSDYVLSRFTPSEQIEASQVAEAVVKTLPWLVVHRDAGRMMTQFFQILPSGNGQA